MQRFLYIGSYARQIENQKYFIAQQKEKLNQWQGQEKAYADSAFDRIVSTSEQLANVLYCIAQYNSPEKGN